MKTQKKLNKLIIMIALVLAAAFVLTACNFGQTSGGDPTVASIAIKTPATQTSFDFGEDFNSAGLVVERVMSDGTKADLAASEYTVGVSAFNKNAADILAPEAKEPLESRIIYDFLENGSHLRDALAHLTDEDARGEWTCQIKRGEQVRLNVSVMRNEADESRVFFMNMA